MDAAGEHYAKWSKPGGERQIPYDLTYKRNLTNQTNKQQNRTRDIEIKNNLTVTRGEVGGGNGGTEGRVVRNMYKGHMDKAKRGRFEGERQGSMEPGAEVGWKWRQMYLSNNKFFLQYKI